MIRIENWSLITDDNPYLAPEQRKVRLRGDVIEHPRLGYANDVQTSSIKDVEGHIVKTSSGSVYQLGEPSPEYVKWCQDNGHYVPTREVPIIFKK
jgi:hypothetical protein